MFRRILAPLAMSVLLLVPGIGSASLSLVCEMDGQIRQSCCCDHEIRAQAHCGEIAAPGCCDVRPGGDQATPRSQVRISPEAPPAPLLVALASQPVFAGRAAQLSREACELPPGGPPLFLRNCKIIR